MSYSQATYMKQFRDRVKEVEIIFKAVRAGAKSSIINKNQCKRLACVYNEIGDVFNDLVMVDGANDVLLLPLLDEVIRVLERGKLLVLQYGSAQWFELAVMRGDNQEAFSEIYLLVETNMETLQDLGISKDGLVGLQVFRSKTSRAKKLKYDDAREDHNEMVETLRRLYNSLPTAIATLEGKPKTYHLPVNMQIDPEEVILGKQIAKGGYGLVSEAYWLGCKFAAKIITATDVSALQKEVGILAKLSHPHIVQPVGFCVWTDKKSMILMELMDRDLRHLIKARLKFAPQAPPFPPKVAIDIISQIAAGMAYLHNKGVFHGDLKASNVLVKNFGGHIEAKIADFGVSQTIHITERLDMQASTSEHNDGDYSSNSHSSFVYSNPAFTGMVGTTGYMAPKVSHIKTKEGEVPSKKPTYTAKADVYSFAMTCHEILSGEPPFANIPRHSIHEEVLKGVRPDLPLHIDRRLSSLIQECWESEPENRPTFESICIYLQQIKVMESEPEKRPTLDNIGTNLQEIKVLETKLEERPKFQQKSCTIS